MANTRRAARCWISFRWAANSLIASTFFDDEIDSLRLFDADTQRTLEEVEAINLLPAHEFPTDKAAIELFRSQWRDTFEVKRDAEHIYQQVSKGTLPARDRILAAALFQRTVTAITETASPPILWW